MYSLITLFSINFLPFAALIVTDFAASLFADFAALLLTDYTIRQDYKNNL